MKSSEEEYKRTLSDRALYPEHLYGWAGAVKNKTECIRMNSLEHMDRREENRL
jgi:hypothetical protein